MAFGQYAGPPALASQLDELLTLLRGAGHAGFRDARGPMGFTQRQAGGKFSRDEAAVFIERLQDAASPIAASPWRLGAPEQMLRRLPVEQLVLELRRRGWTVTEPSGQRR
jgi:hypothetical protein